MQKSGHIAISAGFPTWLIFFFLNFLVFENVVKMLFVWWGIYWRQCKMWSVVLLRSNLTCLCNLTSSLQFVLYLQGWTPHVSWVLVWDILPWELFHIFVTCNHLVMSMFDQTFPLIFFRVLGNLVLAPSKATSDLISYMARQLPKK